MSDRTCVIETCERKHHSRGWCKYHYDRAKRAGHLGDRSRELVHPMSDLDTRLRNIGWTVTDQGCWEWSGSRHPLGYGRVGIGNRRGVERAHRAAYMAWVGPIPDGSVVCHHCDNPPCVNPAHLFAGTKEMNTADMILKRRNVNGERHPHHKLTDVEVAAIRALRQAGVMYRDIATAYGISRTGASQLGRGDRRRDLTNPEPKAVTQWPA